ncbi:50S ribosomal protein L2 [Oopsacas minuta]|uniref:50S ribosomal protein L2 n=1 Tax=Oopsacas minuta TaxID=111878 RepID=A0AAV7JH55_9METZ|nr:50S ribosomal protein L2 [Oopsacas minuta]
MLSLLRGTTMLLQSNTIRPLIMIPSNLQIYNTHYVRKVSTGEFPPHDETLEEVPRVRIIKFMKSVKRSGYVALVARGRETFQIMANEEMKVGDTPIYTSEEGVIDVRKFDPRPGNTYPLSSIPDGIDIFNLEVTPGGGGKIGRGAGVCCKVIKRKDDIVTVKLPSGKTREFNKDCKATVGAVGNKGHSSIHLGKAGTAVNLRRAKRSRRTKSFVTI